jgi:hypothetical protein
MASRISVHCLCLLPILLLIAAAAIEGSNADGEFRPCNVLVRLCCTLHMETSKSCRSDLPRQPELWVHYMH